MGYSSLSIRLERLPHDASGCAVAREAHRLKRDLRETDFKTRYGQRYRLVTIVESEVRVLRVRALGQKLLRVDELPSEEYLSCWETAKAHDFLKHTACYAVGSSLIDNELGFVQEQGVELKANENRMQELLRFVIKSDLF